MNERKEREKEKKQGNKIERETANKQREKKKERINEINEEMRREKRTG